MHFNPSQIHNFYSLASDLQLLNSYKLLLVTTSMFEPTVMFGQPATAMIDSDAGRWDKSQEQNMIEPPWGMRTTSPFWLDRRIGVGDYTRRNVWPGKFFTTVPQWAPNVLANVMRFNRRLARHEDSWSYVSLNENQSQIVLRDRCHEWYVLILGCISSLVKEEYIFWLMSVERVWWEYI
jgi:hypothetical protein